MLPHSQLQEYIIKVTAYTVIGRSHFNPPTTRSFINTTGYVLAVMYGLQ
jgi:hypothetical protein